MQRTIGKDNKNNERKNDVGQQQQNGENREQRFNRKNRENRENQPLNNSDGSAGGNRAGGNRNDRGQNRRQFGKREFDRQSGSDKTGVKAVDKRDGAGAHNWGTHKQDIDDYQKGYDNNDDKKEDKANNSDAKVDGEQNGKDANEQVQIEEEAKEITLDEWKAQRAERAKPQYNIRKAGEGEDTSQWKKMIALDNRKKKVTTIATFYFYFFTFAIILIIISFYRVFICLFVHFFFLSFIIFSLMKAKRNMNTIHPCIRNG